MNTPTILPELDMKVLQEKANEYAMKGAIESIKEYYSGYNSPFRKAIEEELKTKSIGKVDLPDIIGIINSSLSGEIEKIANVAISQTYIPYINKFLTRARKEMLFSEVLKEFVECADYDTKFNDCEIFVDENEQFGWFNVEMQLGDKEYKFTLHLDHDSKKENSIKKYQILSIPNETTFTTKHFGGSKKVMTLKVEGAILEFPFTVDVLKDKVTAFIATMILADTKITMDTKEFDENMFPEDECHCDH